MGAVAFISDIHGNSEALEAVLADIQTRQIAAVYCLGDLVGYGPNPNGVIDLVRQMEIPTILGNSDDDIAWERSDCGCYFPDERAKRLGEASYQFTVREVTPENKAYLRALPREKHLFVNGWRLHLVHGSPRRLNEYLLPDRPERSFWRLASNEEDDVLVFGHTHQSWHRWFGRVLFVNVGSVGKPRDGDPRAAYTLLNLKREPGVTKERGTKAIKGASKVEGATTVEAGTRVEEAITVEVVRVAYDVEATARAIIAAGLPADLAEALRRAG
ncbi:MAG: metallophosphoesterase family protein [Thermoleophilia bacterium]|nr:metallophosphoesterase family protein [Thermoleophilia bacterium]